MLNWARNHPIWATLLGLLLLFILWMLFFRGSSSAPQQAAVGTVTQDPSVVAAGQQLQALQIQGQYQTQQAQLAADVESDRNAAQIAIATLQAQLAQNTTDQQAAVALAQLTAQQHSEELASTLAAQIEASRIQAETQSAQLNAATQTQIATLQATTMAQLEAGRNATTIALQQSQAELMKQIQASNAAVQTQLIASNQAVQTAAIKAQPKQSLLSKIGCLLTTAYVELQNKPDDCAELQLARMWRDTWLAKQHAGCDLIAIYYEGAPRFLNLIANRDDRAAIIKAIGHGYIDPFTELVERGEYRNALVVFTNMLEYIGRTYDEELLGSLNAWHGRRSRLLMAA